jgi:hypothetical protein
MVPRTSTTNPHKYLSGANTRGDFGGMVLGFRAVQHRVGRGSIILPQTQKNPARHKARRGELSALERSGDNSGVC